MNFVWCRQLLYELLPPCVVQRTTDLENKTTDLENKTTDLENQNFNDTYVLVQMEHYELQEQNDNCGKKGSKKHDKKQYGRLQTDMGRRITLHI